MWNCPILLTQSSTDQWPLFWWFRNKCDTTRLTNGHLWVHQCWQTSHAVELYTKSITISSGEGNHQEKIEQSVVLMKTVDSWRLYHKEVITPRYPVWYGWIGMDYGSPTISTACQWHMIITKDYWWTNQYVHYDLIKHSLTHCRVCTTWPIVACTLTIVMQLVQWSVFNISSNVSTVCSKKILWWVVYLLWSQQLFGQIEMIFLCISYIWQHLIPLTTFKVNVYEWRKHGMS